MEFIIHCVSLFVRQVFILAVALIFISGPISADIPPGNPASEITMKKLEWLFPNISDKPLGDFQSITIPLKRAGHLFLIEARIDEQVGNLIFDTGATGLVLNKTYFRKYTSTEKPAGEGITGISDKIYRTVVRRIDIMGLHYEDVVADLTDLSHIENRRGVKILGLFSLNMMNEFEVIFDAISSELHLYRVDKLGNRLVALSSGFKFEVTQNMETNHNIMLIQGKIGDKILNFCLDTGAESNVISSDVSKKVMSTIQINRRSGMGGAGAASVDVLYGTMKEFEFGNHQFGVMQTVVTNLGSMSEAYGCSIDGLLGYDFWQKGIFCFNFRKNEISFSVMKGDKK
jgi:predicted aspartyl protease